MSLKLNEVTKGKFDNISAGKFMEIEISKIFPNPDQPRKSFDEDYIEELSQSIKTNGLIQPIAVMKWAEKYMIISGECRWRACKKANLGTIKAHIITADMQKVEELSLIENIQRKDLSDFEIAQYINLLWKSGRYEKKKDLAAAIGKKDTYISKVLSVFNLDDAIIEDMKENKHDIPISVLDEIARSGDKDTQAVVYDKYKAGEIKRDDIKSFKDKEEIAKPTSSEKELKRWEPVVTKTSTGEITFNPTKLIPKETFTENSIQYQRIENIDEIVSTLKWAIEHKYFLKGNELVYQEDHSNDLTFDNCYERAIYDLLLEVEELKAKTKDNLEHKELKENKTSFGFGTQNQLGTFICVTDGEFEGTFTFRKGGEFVKNTNNKEYSVTIKEVDTPKEEPKEIKLMEVLSDSVYIEYTDFDSVDVSFSKAKEIIRASTQESIPYLISSKTEKSCDFINKMPNRTQNNGKLVLKNKKTKSYCEVKIN